MDLAKRPLRALNCFRADPDAPAKRQVLPCHGNVVVYASPVPSGVCATPHPLYPVPYAPPHVAPCLLPFSPPCDLPLFQVLKPYSHTARVAARRALWTELQSGNRIQGARRLLKGADPAELGCTQSSWELTWGTDAAQQQVLAAHQADTPAGDENAPPAAQRVPRAKRACATATATPATPAAADDDGGRVWCNYPGCTNPGRDFGSKSCPGCRQFTHHHMCAIKWGQEAMTSFCHTCWEKTEEGALV